MFCLQRLFKSAGIDQNHLGPGAMDFAVKFAQVEKSLLSLPWKHHFKPLSLCVMVAMVVVRKMPNQILQEGVDVVLVVVASS